MPEGGSLSLDGIAFLEIDNAQIDEAKLVFDLVAHRRADGVMIDVGAHFGGSLSRFAGIGWTIYGFEPDPANRPKLLEKHGGKANIIVSEEAVSDTSGREVPFFASAESSGISGLSAFRDTHQEVARVRTVTLNDVVARHGLTHVEFLKIDVEGFEMAVLRGLDFETLSPDVVLAEFEDGKTRAHGYTVVDLCNFLIERGYVVYASEWYPIERYGVKHRFRRLRRYPCDLPPDSWGNLIAFRGDPPAEALQRAYRHAVTKPKAPERNSGPPAGRKSPPRKRKGSGHGEVRGKAPRRNPLARLVRSMPVSTAAIVAAVILLVAVAMLPDRARTGDILAGSGPWVLAGVIGVVAYEQLRHRMRKQLSQMKRQSARRAARQTRKFRKARASVQALKKDGRKHRQAQRAKLASLRAESAALKTTVTAAEAAQKRQMKTLARVDASLEADLKDVAALRERVATGERQISAIRYPDAPSCIVFFGHHKCGSRFFRNEVFARVSEMTGVDVRQYKVDDPPFHFSRMDDLDLSNMNFDGIGADGRDIVLFTNGTNRSLERIREATPSWKGLRIIRDPRQVLVSDYFHHKGDHTFEASTGWIWETLKRDKPNLLSLPKEEGLLYELDNITKEVIEEQLLPPFDDERILTLKLEDFAAAPRDQLIRISKFLGIADISGIDLTKTFANRNSGDWRDHFTPRLKAVFKERYGQALIDLGYEKDMDW